MYHATRHLEHVLDRGLDPHQANSACPHICLAKSPEIAAGVAEIAEIAVGLARSVVLEVDVSGLDLFLELGEARHHGDVIEPERLKVLSPQPAPITTGWSDPGWRRNHSDCLARLQLPLSRRLLNAADEEMRRRWPWDAYDDDRFRGLLAELRQVVESDTDRG
jgi:hypothetical protein